MAGFSKLREVRVSPPNKDRDTDTYLPNMLAFITGRTNNPFLTQLKLWALTLGKEHHILIIVSILHLQLSLFSLLPRTQKGSYILYVGKPKPMALHQRAQ